MKSQLIPLRVAGILFAIAAAGHIIRLATGAVITVGSCTIPLWVSLPGIFIAGGLAMWMWKASLAAAR